MAESDCLTGRSRDAADLTKEIQSRILTDDPFPSEWLRLALAQGSYCAEDVLDSLFARYFFERELWWEPIWGETLEEHLKMVEESSDGWVWVFD